MLAALRSSPLNRSWKLRFSGSNHAFISSLVELNSTAKDSLDLNEVVKILTDVKADDVKVIPVGDRCAWADHMVIATGRSTWHVKNIAQALLYQAKEKQRGAKRMMLPSVQGQEGGKWIVIDSGKVIVHALDENARAYYNLENLWNSDRLVNDNTQDLEKAFTKIRPKNNSKRPAGRRT
ncbi:Protein Iojap-related mitochondrial [Euphorbia peplus]|nr:Protein Iojap-related mitochondrial [Euphorbia peplus]